MIKSQRKTILKSNQTKEKSYIQEYWWISQQKLSKPGENKSTYTNIEREKKIVYQKFYTRQSHPSEIKER